LVCSKESEELLSMMVILFLIDINNHLMVILQNIHLTLYRKFPVDLYQSLVTLLMERFLDESIETEQAVIFEKKFLGEGSLCGLKAKGTVP